jgi:hypothetical protein
MINIYRSIKILTILQGCETWSPTLRKQRRLVDGQEGVLRKGFGSGDGEENGSGENCIVRIFTSHTHHEMLLA